MKEFRIMNLEFRIAQFGFIPNSIFQIQYSATEGSN